MSSLDSPKFATTGQIFPMYRAWFLTVSTVFILVGVIVRVHGVDDPILGFHPTRQYRSAIIARSCYYDHVAGVSPEHLLDGIA